MDERIILRSPGPVEVLVGFFVDPSLFVFWCHCECRCDFVVSELY